jgi:hypothetical protein
MLEEYAAGNLEQAVFDAHLKLCRQCREHLAVHNRIDKKAAGLKSTIEVPDLWDKIREGIEEESSSAKFRVFSLSSDIYSYAVAAAAVLVLFISITVYQLFRPSESDPVRLLGEEQLKSVVETEKQYELAIRELEKAASIKLADQDIGLALLYKDKLATIEAQIERCKEALKTNPANHHIRKYLFAALQDKRKTLQEILELGV